MGPARHRSAILGVFCVCVALLLCTGMRWHLLRAAARRATEELVTCQEIAGEIASLRTAPHSAVLHKRSEQQISLAIERAAQEAEIPDAEILRITPQPGRRRTKASHVEHSTTVHIRQATLGQLSRFLGELSGAELGLVPTSIQLTAPRTRTSATENEVWSCELVLTYLMFSPE